MPKNKKYNPVNKNARTRLEDDARFNEDMARRGITPGIMSHIGYPGNADYRAFPDEPDRLGGLPLFVGNRYQAAIPDTPLAQHGRPLRSLTREERLALQLPPTPLSAEDIAELDALHEPVSNRDVRRFSEADSAIRDLPRRARPRTAPTRLDPYVEGTRYNHGYESGDGSIAAAEAAAETDTEDLDPRDDLSKSMLKRQMVSQITSILDQSGLSHEQKLKILEEMGEPENEGGSIATSAYNTFNKFNRKMVKNVMVPGMDFTAGLIPAVMGQPELSPLAIAGAHALGTAAQKPLLGLLRSDKRQHKLDTQRQEDEAYNQLVNKYKMSGKGIMNQPRSRSVGSDMLSPMAAATMGHSQAMNMKLKLENDMAMGRRKQIGLVGVSGNLLGPGHIPALQSQPQQNFQFRHTISSPTYRPHVYGNNGLYA